MPTIAVARLELLVSVDAHEGPVYVADEDALYFASVRRESVAIKRLTLSDRRVSVVREDANMANGMALDHDGRLVVCEQGTLAEPARISRVDRRTGVAETVVEGLNSPNDVVVARDGSIWFTDPSYGYLQGFRPEPTAPDAVYRYDPRSGRLSVVSDAPDKPNGIAFSPDERTLYVADNGRPHHLLAFDLPAGETHVFAVATPGHPDGLKVDGRGFVYASAAGGVQVFSPSGELIGEIDLPGAVNFTFGGPDGDVLFVTADDAVWAAHLDMKGA